MKIGDLLLRRLEEWGSDIACLDIEVPVDPLLLAKLPATRIGCAPASPRSRGDCPPPRRQRSWWTRTRTSDCLLSIGYRPIEVTTGAEPLPAAI
jgi:hypothetical protein